MFCKVWFYKWLCECFYMFSILCFEGSTCLTNIVIGTVVTFKFVNTYGCVFFMYGVVCGFVCEVSFEGVVCGVCYVVFQFFDSFSYFFCVDLLWCVSVMNFLSVWVSLLLFWNVWWVLNICSAKFDFISGCVSAFICSVYCVLKDLPVWPM